MNKKFVELTWPKQNSSTPNDVIGKNVKMRLIEHPYKREFTATIEGHRAKEDGTDLVWYLLRIDSTAAATLGLDLLLFLPEYIDDPRWGREFRKSLKASVIYKYRASMEEMLLDPQTPFTSLGGRVYRILNRDILLKNSFIQGDLHLLSRGHVARPSE